LTARRLTALPVVWILLWASAAASAQEFAVQDLELPVRQTVTRAAQQVAAVVTRSVPDHIYTILNVDPVQTDTRHLTPLGARLRGALLVALVHQYRSARLVADPTAEVPPGSVVRVMVELQPFDHQVMALVRIIDRDGLLIDADLVDMPRSTGIDALLQPLTPLQSEPSPDAATPLDAETPLEAEPPQLTLPVPAAEATVPAAEARLPEPEEPPAAPPQSFEQPTPPPSFEQPAPTEPPEPPDLGVPDDSYEPDDVAGFEVPLTPAAEIRFERTLTENDRDRFKLSLAVLSIVAAAIETDVETLIALYRADSAVPFGLHDSGFTGELDAGTYVIEVMAADTSATGTYTLTVSTAEPVPAEADEPVRDAANDRADEPEPEPETETTEAEALAQPTELQSGEAQERLLRQAPEWLQLTAQPGHFYSVTIRSDSDSLRASLHSARDKTAFLALIPSDTGDLVGALYMAADAPVLQVNAPQEDLGLRYTVSLDTVTTPRVFADRAWVDQADLGPLKHHNLRVFSRDVYQIGLDSMSAAFAEVAVLYLPGMINIPPQEPGLSRYELVQGDYLVLVRPLDGRTVGRVCWHLAQGSSECA
jgi:hypothetical protein